MKFKKTVTLVVALSIVLSLGAAFKANEANAGIALVYAGATGRIDTDANLDEQSQNMFAVVLGGILIVAGFEELSFTALLLDADGNLPKDNLRDGFTKAFPFIDNTDVYEKMADKVNEKYNQNKTPDGRAKIALSKDEVIELLKPVQETLTTEQTQKVLRDLGPDETSVKP